jgi:hypothetical protein
VPGNLPIEKDVFHLWTLPNIVDDLVRASRRSSRIDYDADVIHSAAQIPGHKVAGRVVFRPVSYRQTHSLSLKEDSQGGNTAVIDICIGMVDGPAVEMGVDGITLNHVLVNFLLQIDPKGAIGANDFVGADARIRWNVSAGVRDSYVGRDVADRMMRALNRGSR